MKLKKKIKVADKWIGDGYPCFIIAEAGANHDGKLSQAKKLIDIAKESGADAVKFQTFKAEKLASKKEVHKMFETLKKYELEPKWHIELKRYAEKLGIIFLSTAFDEGSVDLLEKINVPAFKVASGDLTHLPLLRYIASKHKPMIVSTGGANLREIRKAIKTIKAQKNEEIVLMHCVSNYPAKIEDANIRAIGTMNRLFNLPTGYSDHSLGTLVPLTAVTLSACIIEKHLTVNRSLPGPDHPFAMEPNEFQKMVKEIRLLEKSLGDGIKCRKENEESEVKVGRRSIVAACNIAKGKKMIKKMIKIVRPGTGIPPKYLDSVIGRKAKINIKIDELITWDKI